MALTIHPATDPRASFGRHDIGHVPLGLGIALNPIAIVVSILAVRTANARRNGLTFAIGWIAGLALLVVLPALFIRDHAGALRNLGADIPDLIWIALGVLLYSRRGAFVPE